MTDERMTRYLELVVDRQNANPAWRWGQTHYNVLYEFDPVAAAAVEQAGYDPFYRDDRVRPMRAFLGTYWKRRESG